MPFPLIFIPAALLAAVKAYLVYHGIQIGMAAILAGYRAHRRGDDVVSAAIEAGASRAAAYALQDFFLNRA